MNLHLIQTSLVRDNALALCLEYKSDDDTIVLAGEAITGLLKQDYEHVLKEHSIKVLLEDAESLNLSSKIQHFEKISYEQFVELTVTHKKVITW
ncbi:sulfurtransferase complex subunit TusB [Shewanella sp. 202IG2-18]|uniref:sulfurtransferase complex subunit TusB n=1 Tax=Parashewanella hymeniacidonis TaxID=2807618 RepID=UPI001961E57D|nr:sulfurtransferase complex subunit TusB [Parashewanella hymeniacidonis]MBM7074519.1 sulfurtransferase complex subunit TusB [Parashewanella hymeniacidonis]